MSGSWLGRPLRMGPASSRATTVIVPFACACSPPGGWSEPGRTDHPPARAARRHIYPHPVRGPVPALPAGRPRADAAAADGCAGGVQCSGLAAHGVREGQGGPVRGVGVVPSPLEATWRALEVGATAESAADQSTGRRRWAGSVCGPVRWCRSSATTTTSTPTCGRPSRTFTGNELADEDVAGRRRRGDLLVARGRRRPRRRPGRRPDEPGRGGRHLAAHPQVGPARATSSRREIEDAAPTAGLHATSTISASRDWTGTRLATPRAARPAADAERRPR